MYKGLGSISNCNQWKKQFYPNHNCDRGCTSLYKLSEYYFSTWRYYLKRLTWTYYLLMLIRIKIVKQIISWCVCVDAHALCAHYRGHTEEDIWCPSLLLFLPHFLEIVSHQTWRSYFPSGQPGTPSNSVSAPLSAGVTSMRSQPDFLCGRCGQKFSRLHSKLSQIIFEAF